MHNNSLVLLLALLSGCATTHPAANDAAVRECERYLGKGEYSVIEKVELKSGGIWSMLDQRSAEPGKLMFDDWQVHWPDLEWWGKQRSVALVLFEQKPDTLVYCEVTTCAPLIMRLKRVPSPGGGYDRWQLAETNKDVRICAIE